MGKDLLFTVVLLICLGFAGGCWILDRRLERLRSQFKSQTRKLNEALQRLRHFEDAAEAEVNTPQPAPFSASFDADLSQAQMCQRLKGGEGGGAIPEKYRLVVAMARRGLGAEDISQILDISVGETEQLLKLALVGCNPEKSPGEN